MCCQFDPDRGHQIKGMRMNIQRMPYPVDSYAQEMFDAISKVCDLPDCETKDRLLFGLSHAVVGLCAPTFIVTADGVSNE